MKEQRAIVQIKFTPFVCGDCGQLQVMADFVRGQMPLNCDSCKGENVFKAGPEQQMNVSVFKRALQPFQRGDS